ncbi:MAG: ABC transporter substrate-binding protein, partial [Rhodospirillaceae bacterium]|nr:ABC transporter substrate-binding protein [Rhodospirillaceae bacterium]
MSVRSVLCFAVLLLTAILGHAGSAWAKPTVASVDSCLNQLVLTLADREQIVSLSSSVVNPWSSFLYQRARDYKVPLNHRSAEEMVELRPDLVFLGASDRGKINLLDAAGLRHYRFLAPKTIAGATAQIREVARLLEQGDRGEALVFQIEAAQARATARLGKTSPRAVVYTSGGSSKGDGT